MAGYGFCELLSTFTDRGCRYVTLLREPVSRLVSDWNYFCIACMQNGHKCVKDMALRDAIALNNSRLPRDDYGLPLLFSLPTSAPRAFSNPWRASCSSRPSWNGGWERSHANMIATIVSAVAVLLLSGVVAFYAQRELAKLAGGDLDAQAASRWSEVV